MLLTWIQRMTAHLAHCRTVNKRAWWQHGKTDRGVKLLSYFVLKELQPKWKNQSYRFDVNKAVKNCITLLDYSNFNFIWPLNKFEINVADQSSRFMKGKPPYWCLKKNCPPETILILSSRFESDNSLKTAISYFSFKDAEFFLNLTFGEKKSGNINR